jgi:thioredoxin-related protein
MTTDIVLRMRFSLVLALIFVAFCGLNAHAADVTGQDLFTGKTLDVKPGSKGTVLVFMSAKCPCSNSHVEAVKTLQKDFGQDFHFVIVHSNADEKIEEARAYFKTASFEFPVIEDDHAKLANEYKAFKTPHAFLISTDGHILYKGGVTDSKIAAGAEHQFLRDALQNVEAGQAVKVADGRTLGCIISRGEKFVW